MQKQNKKQNSQIPSLSLKSFSVSLLLRFQLRKQASNAKQSKARVYLSHIQHDLGPLPQSATFANFNFITWVLLGLSHIHHSHQKVRIFALLSITTLKYKLRLPWPKDIILKKLHWVLVVSNGHFRW